MSQKAKDVPSREGWWSLARPGMVPPLGSSPSVVIPMLTVLLFNLRSTVKIEQVNRSKILFMRERRPCCQDVKSAQKGGRTPLGLLTFPASDDDWECQELRLHLLHWSLASCGDFRLFRSLCAVAMTIT